MSTFGRIPGSLASEVRNALLAHSGRIMPVYAVAETIRKRREEDNVALEDIVEQLIREGGAFDISFELDPMQARDALRGT